MGSRGQGWRIGGGVLLALGIVSPALAGWEALCSGCHPLTPTPGVPEALWLCEPHPVPPAARLAAAVARPDSLMQRLFEDLDDATWQALLAAVDRAYVPGGTACPP